MTVLPAGSTELDVVTGAFSYTGRHIAEALLARGRRVRTLTRRPDPAHPLATRVEVAPFAFDDSLGASLRGADTLYNTYWVRFERGETTFDSAVRNTAALFGAAQRAGVRRIVHISVANPDDASPFPYFRGKARTEELLREVRRVACDRAADAGLRTRGHPRQQHRLGTPARSGLPHRGRRSIAGTARVRHGHRCPLRRGGRAR